MSSRIYCNAQFLPKPGKEAALFKTLQSLEPNTLREDGCIEYRVTRQIQSPFAEGTSFPIVFQEIWRDLACFEAHCQRKEIQHFFQAYCLAEDGLAEKWNVCIYSDEPDRANASKLSQKQQVGTDCV